MKTKQFLLYGGSGHAKVVTECIRANQSEVIGAFDDKPEVNVFCCVPFLGGYGEELHNNPLIVSVGNNYARRDIVSRIKPFFGIVQHPSAIVSHSVTLGEGTVIVHQAIVQAHSVIGSHVIINTGASIDHECVIEDFVHISPQATLCGNVKVGEGTQIGANAVILPGITVGKWVQVGAGAVIINDIPDYSVVVGNPGRIIKNVENQFL